MVNEPHALERRGYEDTNRDWNSRHRGQYVGWRLQETQTEYWRSESSTKEPSESELHLPYGPVLVPVKSSPANATIQTREGSTMGEIIILAVLVLAGWWLYKEGKHIGSRKGFNVGRRNRRRRR